MDEQEDFYQEGMDACADVKKGHALVLRVCRADMTSTNGFKYPGVGESVTVPDWIDNEECGNGAHGWLYGQGDHGSTDYWQSPDAKWLVLEVIESDIRMLGGKCKFPKATVRFVGEKHQAADYIVANEPRSADVAVIGRTVTAGAGQLVTVGALGTATAGDRGTATAGDSGTATAGAFGTATAGHSGTATAGDRGTATAGALGTATAGALGTATAGAFGTATAGHSGEIRVRWYDNKNNRYRTVIGYVGEDGIEANVAYKLDAENKLVRAA